MGNGLWKRRLIKVRKRYADSRRGTDRSGKADRKVILLIFVLLLEGMRTSNRKEKTDDGKSRKGLLKNSQRRVRSDFSYVWRAEK
jgi:hypothetical protein